MTTDIGTLHLDRARATSFGGIAEAYDRYRPPYPDALIDDIAARGATAVLDIASGTGKAAAALGRRGFDVLGVELDERMAAVARAHGVKVEIAAFETWDDAGRTFDLVTCGDAWHWIDPVRGAAKIARVLRPGGTLARFFNYHRLDASVLAVLDEVYEKYAPEAHVMGRMPDTLDGTGFFIEGDAFTPLEMKFYKWHRRVPADEWVGLIATVSDHQRLGVERLGALQRAVHAAILDLGGSIQVGSETFGSYCRRT